MSSSVWAVINVSTGIVENTILWDGSAESGWAPPDGYIAVETDVGAIGWSYLDGVFSPPPPEPQIPLTPEEILSINQSHQSSLLLLAGQQMAPVLVSLQLGDATDDETVIAKKWQAYYRALLQVDLTVEPAEWPEPPTP